MTVVAPRAVDLPRRRNARRNLRRSGEGGLERVRPSALVSGLETPHVVFRVDRSRPFHVLCDSTAWCDACATSPDHYYTMCHDSEQRLWTLYMIYRPRAQHIASCRTPRTRRRPRHRRCADTPRPFARSPLMWLWTRSRRSKFRTCLDAALMRRIQSASASLNSYHAHIAAGRGADRRASNAENSSDEGAR